MARAISRPPRSPARAPRVESGPVALSGTLIVKWIAGRNGEFAVGDLQTPIGEFRVKDALLEQFDEGEYRGVFWVSQIYSKSYEYRGRITIETRASIADLQIDLECDAPQESPSASEPDPIDEAPHRPMPARTEMPVASTSSMPVNQDLLDADSDVDADLFGDDIIERLRARQAVKLDPTVDRQLLRQQKKRLDALCYAFDARSQTWHPAD